MDIIQKKTGEHDDEYVSNVKLKINLESLESSDSQTDEANDIMGNTMKIVPEISLDKEKKRRRIKKNKRIMKKNIKVIQIDIKFNLDNKPCTLHFNNQGQTNIENTNNLQEDIKAITNNQVDKTFQPESENDGVSTKFSFIETASSIGSEDNKFENEWDLPGPITNMDFIRNLDFPFERDNNYETIKMTHIVINAFSVNAFFMNFSDLFKNSGLYFLPYCFMCNKFIHKKSHSFSAATNIIKHMKKCQSYWCIYEMIDDENKSKVENQFSIAQLVSEYIKAPNDELRKRLGSYRIIPKRDAGWSWTYEFDEIYYTCLLCYIGNHIENTKYEFQINDNYQAVHDHINSEVHQGFKSKLAVEEVQDTLTEIHATFDSTTVERYRCELCNYENISQYNYIKHLNDTTHVTRLAEISENDRKKFEYYYCYACLLRWFGHEETFDQHGDQDDHKNRMLYYPYIEHIPKECLTLLTYIKQNKQVLVTESNIVLKNRNIIKNLLHSLKRDLLSIFPNIKAYPFGSRISGLGLPDSDLDVFLDCENTYGGRITYERSQQLIQLIANQLIAFNEIWEIQKVILNCRIPIIRILHIPSKLSSDITVTNGLGVENTKMIKCFIQAFPMCRELILFLKRWFQNHFYQSESNFITSYALAWLVIFYLQHLKIFPSISHLIQMKNESWRISGWETGVNYDFPVGRTDRTFEELLFGFFRYYSRFDYKYSIICPLLGEPLGKNIFRGRVTEKELTPYINYIKRRIDRFTGKQPKRFQLTALSVQDPFDLSHNITKTMNARKLKKFYTICKYATRFLKKTLTGINSKTIEKYDTKNAIALITEKEKEKICTKEQESKQDSRVSADSQFESI